jgi:hypothetical protein
MVRWKHQVIKQSNNKLHEDSGSNMATSRAVKLIPPREIFPLAVYKLGPHLRRKLRTRSCISRALSQRGLMQ